MRTQEYLQEIRKSNGLKNAILTKITVDERNNAAKFHLVTDRAYTRQEEERAVSVTQSFLPEGAKAGVHISKLVVDAELITRRILLILRQKFPAAASFVSERDVTVEKNENGANFYIAIGTGEQGLFRTGHILDVVSAELAKAFCGSFLGNVRTVEREQEEFVPEPALPPPEYTVPARFFDVTDYAEIDGGEKPKRAMYIADVEGEQHDLVLCGVISGIEEKQTSTGKPYFVFHINDQSGDMRVAYFCKKSTVDKARALKNGDSVVCRGEYALFHANLSYTARFLNYGSAPEGFVPEERMTKPVPAAYKAVFPEPFADYNQSDLFASDALPAVLTDNEFVVFDIETTGLNNTGVGGRMDAVIELGAVKMKGGAIVEKFSSFVAADRKLSAEIVELTGITDDMLVGAPDIADVIADFYKFCDGCILVGHNSIGFDFKFINYYAKKNDYAFRNAQYDTLLIAQKNLRLNNYKLNTLADHYGIGFRHHRAFDDALATAKIFINLAKDTNGKIEC